MILGQQQASKVLPLISDLESYDAFLALLDLLHANAYHGLMQQAPYPGKDFYVGQLSLIDELKELRDRLKDSLNGRPD
jgi:hypothetical protein